MHGGGHGGGGHFGGHAGQAGGEGGHGDYQRRLTSPQAIRDAREALGYRPSLFERLKLALQQRRHGR